MTRLSKKSQQPSMAAAIAAAVLERQQTHQGLAVGIPSQGQPLATLPPASFPSPTSLSLGKTNKNSKGESSPHRRRSGSFRQMWSSPKLPPPPTSRLPPSSVTNVAGISSSQLKPKPMPNITRNLQQKSINSTNISRQPIEIKLTFISPNQISSEVHKISNGEEMEFTA